MLLLGRGWDPKVTDSNLLGVVCPGARSEVLSVACDKSCLMGILHNGMLGGGWHWGHGGTEVMGTSSLSFMLERFTCRSDGSWAGLPRASMFQTGGSEKVNCMGSNSPFRPLGHTTWSPHCKSLHTSSWLRHPQAFVLGALSIITLMCPSLDRGVCNAPSLSHAKAYSQLLPMLISSASLCTSSSRSGGRLGAGTSTLLPGWTPSLLWQSCLALLGEMPYHAWVFLHHPMHLGWRGFWYGSDSIISHLELWKGGRDCVTPIPPGLMAPIGQHLWRSVCSCSFLWL